MKMHKLLLIFSLTMLLSINILGQAAVDIPLTATISNYNFSLSVGLDLTATNCIDPQLGESNAPLPGPGETQIRFDLGPYECPGLSTFKDYRSPGIPPVFPFTGLIEHTLWFFVVNGLQIDIAYNLPSNAQMSITDNITGTLLNLGPFTGQGIAIIPGSYTAFATGALLLMEYDNIIPVEFTSFTASVLQNEKAVQLNWSTATETNNKGFEIQRTSPFPSPYQGEGGEAGRGWEMIGFVPGFGTTTEPKSYSFTDEHSLTPNLTLTHTLSYRLKQIDFDGSFTYSNEIEVEVDFTPNEFVLYQNYPNPFNPSTTIKFEIPDVETTRRVVFTTLTVYDVLGNEVATLVNEEEQSGVYEVEFSVGQDSSPDIASGVYFYQLKVEGFVQTKKMILMK